MNRHSTFSRPGAVAAAFGFCSFAAIAGPDFVRAGGPGAMATVISDEVFSLGSRELSLRIQSDLGADREIAIINQTSDPLQVSADDAAATVLAGGRQFLLSCDDALPRVTLAVAVEDLGSRFDKSLVLNCGERLTVRTRGVANVLATDSAGAQP